MSSIQRRLAAEAQLTQNRTLTDWLLEVLTPIMIFIMVMSVVWFLLDVRWVYTAVHDQNIRWVALCFVMGVVALNRLIAREGSEEGFLYFIALAGTVGIYTVATTHMYDVGAIAGEANNPLGDLAINMAIVVFVWWLTNRLTHECCVDENPEAGEIGIIANTAQKFRSAMREGDTKKGDKPKPLLQIKKKEKPKLSFLVQDEIEAFDPTEQEYKMDEAPPDLEADDAPSRRVPKRHPGVSIFYFSIPVFAAFALGIRVSQHGGPAMIIMSQFYMGVYCVAALSLLMLSSLAGLREYFRARYIRIPPGIGVFWIGLGVALIVMVLVGALAFPLPGMPPLADVGTREWDPWNRADQFIPIPVVYDAAERAQQAEVVAALKNFAWVCFGIFGAYAALRGISALAYHIAANRRHYPPAVVRIFEFIDKILLLFTSIPSLPARLFRPRRWVSRDVATCTSYRNPMGYKDGATSREVLDTSYNALCALAYDLDVPRRDDQTPYEFIHAFPPELGALRKNAEELIHMYVLSEYASRDFNTRELDRIRKFWVQYERIRHAVVR